MRITEKELSKLKQLDRIEFRQVYKKIEDDFINFEPFAFFNQMLWLLFFVVLLVIGIYNISPESSLKLFYLIPLIFKIGLFGFIGLFILNVISFLSNSKKKKHLINKYFKVEENK